jgi:predicted PurR-regulated permease PerM
MNSDLKGEASASQWPTRQIILATLTVTAVALFCIFLFRFSQMLIILFAAIIISIALQPIVNYLKRRHISPLISVLIIYVLLILAIVTFLWLGAPLLTQQVATVRENATVTYETIRRMLIDNTSNLIIKRLAVQMPETLATSQTAVAPMEGEEALSAAAQVAIWLSQITNVTLGILATFTLALYWTVESGRIKQTFFVIVPMRHRDEVRQLVATIEQIVSSYVLGQGVLVLAVGTLALIAYLILGLPYAFFLAIIAGIMEAVPLIGPFLGAVPATIIAFSISPLTAVLVIVATLVIQQIENSVLVPRVMARAVGIRPLVSLLSLFAFGSLFGVPGALIAIPLAAVIQLLLDRYLLTPNTSEHISRQGRDEASLLRYKTQDLVNDIRQQIRRKEDVATAATDQIEDSIETIALDLDSLLSKYTNEQETVREAVAVETST